MAKRGQGEGSISKRPDGTWWARISLGRDAHGNRKRQAFYGKTRKEVQEKLTAALHGVNTSTYIEPSKMTMSEWFDIWLNEYKKNTIKPKTFYRYRGEYDRYAKNTIGNLKLKDMRPDIMQKYVNGLSDRGLRASSVQAVLMGLGGAFKKAEDLGLINHNPMKKVDLPKIEHEEVRVLSVEEQAKFVKAAKTSPFGEYFLLALATGLRCGELLALTWDDIDIEQEILRVTKTQAEYITYGLNEEERIIEHSTPKTRYSKRNIPLLPDAILVLNQIKEKQSELRKQYGDCYNDNNYIFCKDNGDIMPARDVCRRLELINDKAGLEGVHVHTLRHTFATRGLESGIELRVMQELLGHSSIKITADLYTHVLPEKKKDSIMKLKGTINLG